MPSKVWAFGMRPGNPLLEFLVHWWAGLATQEARERLVGPLWELDRSEGSVTLKLGRAWLAADWLGSVHDPAFMDLVPELQPHAAKLRALAGRYDGDWAEAYKDAFEDADTVHGHYCFRTPLSEQAARLGTLAGLAVSNGAILEEIATRMARETAGFAACAAAPYGVSIYTAKCAIVAALLLDPEEAFHHTLPPIIADLQVSAQDLYRRMAALGEDDVHIA